MKDFVFENNQYNHINVSLFNDMSAISYVEIIDNLDKLEIKTLEEKNLNE